MSKEAFQIASGEILSAVQKKSQSLPALLTEFAKNFGDKESIKKAMNYRLDLQEAESEEQKAEIYPKILTLLEEISSYKKANTEVRMPSKEMLEKAESALIRKEIVVQCSNIFKTLGKFELSNISLTLKTGEVVGIVGENSTGKTTLLNILSGTVYPNTGTLEYPQWDNNKRDWYKIKNRIAYVPQYLPSWDGSLLDTIRAEAAFHGLLGEENKDAVDYIIHRLGLSEFTAKKWNELSGGYRLRFALAKALVWKPDLLILDEPLAYLDIKAQNIVLNDLRNLAKSIKHPVAILLTSQHLHEVERIADYVYFLNNGKIGAGGKTGEIYSNRTENKFILESPANLSELEAIFAQEFPVKLSFNGFEFLLTTPRDIDSARVLKVFLATSTPVKYFRDVSNSIIREFKG